MSEETTQQSNITLDGGTYEIIQRRLQTQKQELLKRLARLNDERKKVFGAIETELIANDRINTDNNCIARDIVTIDRYSIFGYNVHFGLRTDITLSDVFSIYTFKEGRFQALDLGLIQDVTFKNDFTNLYKYYRNTIFSKFAVTGNYLYMVFQLSESVGDIKAFKWLIKENALQYVDNRSEHEYKFPNQHEFRWQEVTRDMYKYGVHSHVSILDKIFVETIGGDLTIKIEDNTDDGLGIYTEPVEHKDQTLDDGQYRYADLGNLIVLEIKPFQENSQFFVYNHKVQEVKKIPSIKDSAVKLPDDQGIIFSDGYYLQTGEYKLIENDLKDVKFQQKIGAPNGEDFLYVFYAVHRGLYQLIHYNVIDQEIRTPIICNGFTLLSDGELCYFRTENEQTKHHVVQIWQTPFSARVIVAEQHQETLLYKIGNKDLVKAMAECHALINLLNKNDSYDDLYSDIHKTAQDINDGYYWIDKKEALLLNEPVKQIQDAANAAIEEFEKVTQLKKTAANTTKETQQKASLLFDKIKSSSFKSIDDFVTVLTRLRALRGEVISLKEIRYVNTGLLEDIENQIEEQTERISHRCMQFLLNDKALASYHQRVDKKKQDIGKIKKAIQGKKLKEDIELIGTDLELLINTVSGLDIEDASHTTRIIDNISLIFAKLNQLKAQLKNVINSLGSKEAKEEYTAQLKLVDQSMINYIDLASTPEKCDEFLIKITVQLEDLEGRFSDFDEFLATIIEKRVEINNAFEVKKSSLIEGRNKKAVALQKASERILKGVEKKSLTFETPEEINGYFAADLMVSKLRDIASKLEELDDIGKAENLQTKIKVAREDALRKLKDKNELYEDGENIIKFGKHRFGVNQQPIDLTLVYRDQELQYHLTGTDLYGKVDNAVLNGNSRFWDQEIISENDNVYRASYLADIVFKKTDIESLYGKSDSALLKVIQQEARGRYAENYVKGVHDTDASKILQVLITKHQELGLLKYPSGVRAYAQFFWNWLQNGEKSELHQQIKSSGAVMDVFPASLEFGFIIDVLENRIKEFSAQIFKTDLETNEIANYLFLAAKDSDYFQFSNIANEVYTSFIKFLKSKNGLQKFRSSYKNLDFSGKISLVRQWVLSYLNKNSTQGDKRFTDEVVCLELFQNQGTLNINNCHPNQEIKGLQGAHPTIKEGVFNFDYYDFTAHLKQFSEHEVLAYDQYRKAKQDVVHQLKTTLKISEYKPRVLSSFVRNKLIDKVYLPLFGDNLAKQMGTIGDNKRTDRMGMLLLISPPGYGKTTLMEYMANRLGLVFMKINGPAIGHKVTSVDPAAAGNAAAKEELKKLNLAFEMGNNVMLYVDDIQHCNPEFLQKFISLADGTRKIEGVFGNQTRTYDLRGKKFCVVMAGNPYTESGARFQIPDMLSNRADIYNLGDIIGDTEALFKLSLIENSLTSNTVLHQLSSKNFDDVYSFIQAAEAGSLEGIEFKGNHSKQEMEEYIRVLQKVLKIRDTVLRVNQTYISSAAMEDAYRTEPAFKLQGSYRDMNKLAAKVVAVMNDKELDSLLLSHYESESQTLTTSAEANLLKYKELTQILTKEEELRWELIKKTFVKNNKLKGIGNNNHMGQVLGQMMQFSENLEGIKEVLKKGLD